MFRRDCFRFVSVVFAVVVYGKAVHLIIGKLWIFFFA